MHLVDAAQHPEQLGLIAHLAGEFCDRRPRGRRLVVDGEAIETIGPTFVEKAFDMDSIVGRRGELHVADNFRKDHIRTPQFTEVSLWLFIKSAAAARRQRNRHTEATKRRRLFLHYLFYIETSDFLPPAWGISGGGYLGFRISGTPYLIAFLGPDFISSNLRLRLFRHSKNEYPLRLWRN